MEKISNTIEMPKCFVTIDANQKEYVYGGVAIPYNISYSSKIGAMAFATSYKKSHSWGNISTYDLAAEVFFHAVLFYKGAAVVSSLLSKAGGKIGAAASGIANSLNNGIDIENGKDRNKVMGIERWMIYDAFYAVAPSKF